MSDSLRPYRLQPARLLSPQDSPSKNTGEGCHALLQGSFPPQGSTSVSYVFCIDSQVLYRQYLLESPILLLAQFKDKKPLGGLQNCQGKHTDWNCPPWTGTIVTICMSHFMTGDPDKEQELISHHQPEEFGRGQKETPRVRPLPRIPLASIHLG